MLGAGKIPHFRAENSIPGNKALLSRPKTSILGPEIPIEAKTLYFGAYKLLFFTPKPYFTSGKGNPYFGAERSHFRGEKLPFWGHRRLTRGGTPLFWGGKSSFWAQKPFLLGWKTPILGPNTLWAARPDLEAKIFILGYKPLILRVESACFVDKIIYWGGCKTLFWGKNRHSGAERAGGAGRRGFEAKKSYF